MLFVLSFACKNGMKLNILFYCFIDLKKFFDKSLRSEMKFISLNLVVKVSGFMTWLGCKRVFELAKVITSTPIKNIFYWIN